MGTVDWSNSLEAYEAATQMFEAGVDPQKIQAFWAAATAGSDAYIDSQEEAYQYASKLQGKTKELSELSQRLSDGTATLEDVQKL